MKVIYLHGSVSEVTEAAKALGLTGCCCEKAEAGFGTGDVVFEVKFQAEEPKAEEPKAEEPKAEEPKKRGRKPKAEEPKAEEPKAGGEWVDVAEHLTGSRTWAILMELSRRDSDRWHTGVFSRFANQILKPKGITKVTDMKTEDCLAMLDAVGAPFMSLEELKEKKIVS